MLGYILFAFFIILTIYAYIDHNGHFTATTSAIQQIWSGNCRLACRNTKSVQKREHFAQSEDGGTSSQVETDYHDNCICASCPCLLVENVLQTCSPITHLYCTIVEAIFLAFYDLIKACTDLYERTYSRLSNCKQRTEGLKVGQIGVNQVTNFMFNDSAKLLIKKTDDKDPVSEPGTSNGPKTDEAITSSERMEDYDSTSCPACIEKGMTCIGKCPTERSKKE